MLLSGHFSFATSMERIYLFATWNRQTIEETLIFKWPPYEFQFEVN